MQYSGDECFGLTRNTGRSAEAPSAGALYRSSLRTVYTERMQAIVREPSPALLQCALTFLDRQPIDFERALRQHAGYVARGEAEMAIQQVNVSKPVAGTDYVGDLPGELHEYVVFSIAIMAASKQQEAAKALVGFVTSPQAAPLLQAGMMEPATA
jgi:ABC-type molybdate transport system substrate-binding protein